jgi:hypothetical protein
MLQAPPTGQQQLNHSDSMGSSSNCQTLRDSLGQALLQQLLGVDVVPLTASTASGVMPGAAEAAARELHMAAQRALKATLCGAVEGPESAGAAHSQLMDAAAGLHALGHAPERGTSAAAAGMDIVASVWGHSAVSGAPAALQPLLLEVALAASEQLQAQAKERVQQQLAALAAEQFQALEPQYARFCDAAQHLQQQAAMEVGSGVSAILEQLLPQLMHLWVSPME